VWTRSISGSSHASRNAAWTQIRQRRARECPGRRREEPRACLAMDTMTPA